MATLNSVSIKANEIRAAATQLGTLANTFNTSETGLKNIKNRLYSIWEGPAADEFFTRFSDLTDEDLDEFRQAILKYKDFLNRTATDTDSANAQIKSKETTSLNDSAIEGMKL